MYTINIYDDQQHEYTVRVGCISAEQQFPKLWFGELYRIEGTRLSFVELVSYTDDKLHNVSMVLSALVRELRRA